MPLSRRVMGASIPGPILMYVSGIATHSCKAKIAADSFKTITPTWRNVRRGPPPPS